MCIRDSSITATQSTRLRTFFWGNSLPRNASLRNFPRILHGTPTIKTSLATKTPNAENLVFRVGGVFLRRTNHSSNSFSRIRRAPVGHASAHLRQSTHSRITLLCWNSGRMVVSKPRPTKPRIPFPTTSSHILTHWPHRIHSVSYTHLHHSVFPGGV